MSIFSKIKQLIERFKDKKEERDKSNRFTVLDTPYVEASIPEVTKKRWYISNAIRIRDYYLIVLTGKKDEPVEIISENELYKPMHPTYIYTVIGIARDKDGAYKLLTDIYQDISKEQGSDINVALYFEKYPKMSVEGDK